MDYLYDGTFEGFLTCVYFHYYEEKASGIFPKDCYQSNILSECRELETDWEKANKVYEAIRDKISPLDLQRIYRVFLSSVDQKEIKMLHYIRLGFKEGAKVSLLHGNPITFDIQQAEKKVTVEVHRLYGLIRFSVLEGEILYSPIEPDHDILELIAEHFSDRYKSDPFIIHDKRRDKALIAKDGKWYLSEFYEEQVPELSKDEKKYRALWKKYFETIAIKERTNPRCQKTFMPVRYWKYLIEI
ncbi:TIGR03915 family putative DNA repair protein [Clostridium aminobutyricum]|uniref:TIGR03915 family putative DNA repair protein n=1 Tax=Clostridium aminobutyricum TaxID=33953 RepID=A0A939D8H8_CLOAM|nr:TIGR03915 family putative DNA repair protein [Clostridium aminobutyricum]MBN7773177.1 TIGR03915 family putative DNA repair protein [Clostridium aminobutyricum]